MQKELKFRCWDKSKNIMGIVEALTLGEVKDENWICYRTDSMEVKERPTGNYVKKKDAVIMQFVGLKDKNGKEIFEGDIIRFDNDWYSEVYQHGCGEWFAASFSIWENISEDGKENSWEVIGNIYTTLELLK